MGHYAKALDPKQELRWRIAGLLHDFDYEKHPSTEEHPFIGVKHLEQLGIDAEVRTAILAHAEYSGTPRDTPMAKALFAVDELSGFIVACAKVRPDGIASLEPKSVKKKLKDKSFAAAVSREDIQVGSEEIGELMGIDRDAHIANCIGAIRAMG
jgi:predicted hydrolase (HD superfamily)